MLIHFLSSRAARQVAAYLGIAWLGITTLQAQVADPGPRGGTPSAGGAAPGLSSNETGLFYSARDRFAQVYSVSGGIAGEDGAGLGPSFNGNSCTMCHSEPNIGGSSPAPTTGFVRVPNPQTAMATLDRLPGQSNAVPSFITAEGPVRDARFIAMSNQNFAPLDGGVHEAFTISGRIDAGSCTLAQPNFTQQLANNNVVFRIPTPLFGLGLVESTPDATLQANLAANLAAKAALGISGTLSASDGPARRFGWKAQGTSLLAFVAEHANVEMGLTNEGSPTERSAGAGCAVNPTPEDATNIYNPDSGGSLTGTASEMSSAVVNFAIFARFSAPPTPTTSSASELNGKAQFAAIGCNLCHSSDITSGASRFTGQSNVTYHPYSDFALHHMGSTLADGIVQGAAGPDMFRTAPLWGVGQRLFFLHDGRTSNLLDAIRAHSSPGRVCAIAESAQLFQVNGTLFRPLTASRSCGSEANGVIAKFMTLTSDQQQDILNFLRSL